MQCNTTLLTERNPPAPKNYCSQHAMYAAKQISTKVVSQEPVQ